MKERYTTTDKSIKILRKKIVRRWNDAKADARLTRFDELTVISAVDELYKRLDSDFRDSMLELAIAIYEEAEESGSERPTKKYLNKLLSKSDPVTKYAYTSEALRKRDRLKEALETRSDTAYEWRKAMSFWANMAAQYADCITDEVTLKAYRDAGVKYVMWVTQRDEKVCEDCRPRNGTVYPIDEAPPKKHWHCRCYYIPWHKE